MSTTLRVTLPIGDVPERATVTKIKGSKTYAVRERLSIYPHLQGPPQIIEARGTRFLVAEDGSIVAASLDQEFEWHVTYEDLHYWLTEQLEPTPQ
jgi:hypothetical protein